MKFGIKFVVLAVFVSVSGMTIAQMTALTPSQTVKLPSVSRHYALAISRHLEKLTL